MEIILEHNKQSSDKQYLNGFSLFAGSAHVAHTAQTKHIPHSIMLPQCPDLAPFCNAVLLAYPCPIANASVAYY